MKTDSVAIQERIDAHGDRQAASVQCDVAELIKLAQHQDPMVRQRIAENPATPRMLLRLLSRDSSEQVRLSAAENPRISYSSLLGMLKDESADLRYALAENHNLPLSIIAQLTHDENPYVAIRAQKTLVRCANHEAVDTLFTTIHACAG